MAIQNSALVLLLLLSIASMINAGPAAYVACVTICSAGCSVGTILIGTPLCLAACQALCAPTLVAPTP
jgi:hypothetical protein